MQKTYLVKQRFFMNGSYEEGKTIVMEEQVARAFIPNFLQEVVVKNTETQAPKDEEIIDNIAVSEDNLVLDDTKKQETIGKNKKVKKG